MPLPESWFHEKPNPDLSRGQYLCEICEETMTDDVLTAAESPHGLELAICARCRATLRRP